MLLSIGIWIGLTAPATMMAQEKVSFRSFTTEEGLSDDNVLSLLQDHQGFIWIGTTNGLNRFDGQRIIVFKEDPSREGSLVGNWINGLYEDSKHRIWIATDKGMNLLRPGKLEFEFIPLTEPPDSPKLIEVIRIEEDKHGKIWLGTRLEGLIRLGPESPDGQWSVRQFVHDPQNPHSLTFNHDVDLVMNPVGSPLENSSEDDLLIFTHKGLNRINTVTEKLERIPNVSKLALWNKYELAVSHLCRVANKGEISLDTMLNATLKILGPNAVLDFNEEFAPDVNYGEGPFPKFVLYFATTGREQIWATGFRGLYSYHLQTGQKKSFFHDPYKKGSLASNSISCILTDKDNNLWIGTRLRGLNLLPNGQFPFEHHYHEPNNAASLSSDHILSISMDKEENLWLRNNDGDVDKLTFFPNQGWRKTQTMPLNASQILQTRSGMFFMPSPSRGFIEYSPARDKMTIYPIIPGDRVYPVYHFGTLCEDRTGNIWMGPRGRLGMFKWDMKTKQLLDYRGDSLWAEIFNNKSIEHIFEDQEGQLWFSTDEGLYVFDREHKPLKTFLHDPADPHTISGSKVWSVFEDSRENMWISTNYGLNLYKKGRWANCTLLRKGWPAQQCHMGSIGR